jgi:hypothetical protein
VSVIDGALSLGSAFTQANIGMINASNGTVNITGTLDNRNRTLKLDPSNAAWQLAGGMIQGGIIESSGAAGLRVPASGTLDGVVLEANLTLDDSADLRVINGLTLNGVATLNGGINLTTLNFDGTQTLDGTGQLIFVGPPNTVVQPLNGALTIGPGLTIRGGSGTVGNSTLPLINQGTITAEGAGSILHILGNPFTNTGSTNELNGGKIVLGP